MKIIKTITSQTDLSTQQAWWLVQAATSKTKESIIAHNYQLSSQEQQTIESWIHEIKHDHKPLAYVIGWQPFLDLAITVQPPTLIPRPETEEWTEQVIDMIKKNTMQNITILDIGTGSGCIGLALAKAFPQATVYATDICQKALALAQQNALNNNIKNITFLQSDLFSSIPSDLRFDLIVSNPPYIPPHAKLEPCVTDWEDHKALFAQDKGLHIIQQIIQQVPNWVKHNNLPYQLVIEIDSSHTNKMSENIQSKKVKSYKLKRDSFQNIRTVWISL